MSNKQRFLDLIDLLSVQMDILKNQFIEYFKDKAVPLEDRWDVYTKACIENVFINEYCWIFHSVVIEDKLKLDYYDDLYIQKYQTISFLDMVEQVEDEVKNNEKFVNFSKSIIDELKEEILQSGYSSFIFDW